jgi:hypothetical protein
VNLIRRWRWRRCTVGEDVDTVRELAEVVRRPTTSAPRRSGPSESILLTNESWFTCQLCLIYGVAWWGPQPTNLKRPDQSVIGDGLGPRDQVLEIKNSNSRWRCPPYLNASPCGDTLPELVRWWHTPLQCGVMAPSTRRSVRQRLPYLDAPWHDCTLPTSTPHGSALPVLP